MFFAWKNINDDSLAVTSLCFIHSFTLVLLLIRCLLLFLTTGSILRCTFAGLPFHKKNFECMFHSLQGRWMAIARIISISKATEWKWVKSTLNRIQNFEITSKRIYCGGSLSIRLLLKIEPIYWRSIFEAEIVINFGSITKTLKPRFNDCRLIAFYISIDR